MRLAEARGWVPFALVALVVAACGSPATPAPSSAAGSAPPASIVASPSPGPSASPTPAASKGPATAQFSIVGTAGLTGAVTAQTINCNRPSLDGPEIFYIGQSASGPSIVIFARAGHVEVRVGTGSASTLRLRTFAGSGVTSFDAASGMVLNSQLTETTDPSTAKGSLGALSSISGAIDCGDQQPGSSTVVVSGLTPYGQLDGPLTSASVTCTITASSGTFVGVNALGTAGSTPVLIFVTAGTGSLQVSVGTRTAGAFYTAKGAALTTLGSNGATMSGDVSLSVPTGASPSPNLLHVAGSATCGVTVHQ